MSAMTRIAHAVKRLTLALAALLLLLASRGASADEFEIRTASLGLENGAWRLTARIDYRLNEEALEALENGVPLTFTVEVAVDRVRRWLPDAGLVSVTREWQLSYEPLSRRYLVRYPDGGEPTSHATLFGALSAAGRVQGLAVADAPALASGESYDVAVRALLSHRTLPGPLQFLNFWSGSLSLGSEWYEWTVAP
jgi:hypothetical protein